VKVRVIAATNRDIRRQRQLAPNQPFVRGGLLDILRRVRRG
jgi:hypothetical protein